MDVQGNNPANEFLMLEKTISEQLKAIGSVRGEPGSVLAVRDSALALQQDIPKLHNMLLEFV